MADFISTAADINVDEIMTQIRAKIADKIASGAITEQEIDEITRMELNPMAEVQDVPQVYEPHLYQELAGAAFVPEPFPLELIQIHETGSGIKGVVKHVMAGFRKLLFPVFRFMLRPWYVELMNAIIATQHGVHDFHQEERSHFAYFSRLTQNSDQSWQSKEYIKLLHLTANRLVTELSMLKIEHETMKTKIKSLEDKLEFVENRERSIEKKVFAE